MCRCSDNQEVGLEAATLERVRNSSLVECRCADNPAGQSVVPKRRMQVSTCMVGERRLLVEAAAEARRGELSRANAGMSNREVGCEPPPPEASGFRRKGDPRRVSRA
jgi:hypothetical protein